MAEEAQHAVSVFDFPLQQLVRGHVFFARHGVACSSRFNASETLGVRLFGFGVEGYELEVGVALVAYEAGGVETFA